jgi:hypothetical protein
MCVSASRSAHSLARRDQLRAGSAGHHVKPALAGFMGALVPVVTTTSTRL